MVPFEYVATPIRRPLATRIRIGSVRSSPAPSAAAARPASCTTRFLQTLRDAFAEDAQLPLYTQDGEQLRLQAQHGHDTVVHTLDLDAHLDRPVRLDLLHARRPPRADRHRPAVHGRGARGAGRRGGGAAGGDRGPRHARALTESATTRLSRAFVRIAAQNDGDGLLELTCRTVGDLLELEAVQCLIGPLEQPGARARCGVARPTSPAAVDLAKARTATLALGGEPGRVGEYVIVPLRAGRQWLGVLAGIAHAVARSCRPARSRRPSWWPRTPPPPTRTSCATSPSSPRR